MWDLLAGNAFELKSFLISVHAVVSVSVKVYHTRSLLPVQRSVTDPPLLPIACEQMKPFNYLLITCYTTLANGEHTPGETSNQTLITHNRLLRRREVF